MKEQTCSNGMGCGGWEELQTITTHGNLEEKLEPNLDKVIDNIQVEPVEPIQPVVSIVKPKQLIVIATKSS